MCPRIHARNELSQKYNQSSLDCETRPFSFLRFISHQSSSDQFLKTISTQILSCWPPPSGLWNSTLAGVPQDELSSPIPAFSIREQPLAWKEETEDTDH